MKTSSDWLNQYLDPHATVDEQADALTRAGFPDEERAELPGGDVMVDYELTSNRGDCLGHVGLAREIAAVTGRTFTPPNSPATAEGDDAAQIAAVTNEDHDRCPLYTARIIRGVTVGPSPDWLAGRLEAIGLIPRNNLVDLTNFVLFELGQPTHVFDLKKLAGPEIIIRRARDREPFLPIGEGAKPLALTADDLVIADADRAVAIAGVKGGADTAVSDTTTDILIEAAAFDPAAVRNASRRHQIASDSSYRFERGVAPATVDPAADRLTELILELCGGERVPGVIRAGKPLPEPRTVALRPDRCRALIGVDVTDAQIIDWLTRLGFRPKPAGTRIDCVVPHARLDIEREADLIEEVARMLGHDNIPLDETINIRVAPPQSDQLARRAVNDALVGFGYVETVTHSLVSDRAAALFLPPGLDLLRVDDERAGAEPALRPSILPSLLRVLATNRHRGVDDVKLFETAATFAERDDEHLETRNLAIVLPADHPQHALREIRGIIERLVHLLLGPDAAVTVTAHGGDNALPWLNPHASVQVDGRMLGNFGIITKDVRDHFDLADPVCAAELGLPALYDRYPPITQARALPAFPAIERDVSAILDETTPWAAVETLIASLDLLHCEAVEYVTTYRGKQIGRGSKSVTLRLRFRSPERTLAHDEVDPQMEQVVDGLKQQLGAEIRS